MALEAGDELHIASLDLLHFRNYDAFLPGIPLKPESSPVCWWNLRLDNKNNPSCLVFL